jgi:hypothetical protein
LGTGVANNEILLKQPQGTKMKNEIIKLAAALSFLASITVSLDAAAAAVTAIDGGVTLTIPAVNYIGKGPQTVAPGITWSSDSAISLYGYNDVTYLGDNGQWNGGTYAYVGANSLTATMTFNFATPVAGFGGFMNYFPNFGEAEISAYDSSGTLLDTLTLSISTPDAQDAGEFHGFVESTANISSFTMSGFYIVGSNFVVLNSAPSELPEPTTVGLLALGLLGFATSRRKSAKSKNA